MKLFNSILILSSMISTIYGAPGYYGCPAYDAEPDCESMEFCSVCNNQGTVEFPDHIGCSQCNAGFFLYGPNQCLQCQDTFGMECLHCSTTQGCQQCIDGYTREFDPKCGIHFCKATPPPQPGACDINCRVCQNINDPKNAYCSQCNDHYFLGDNSGLNGCLNCNKLFGNECLFCANLQGCQQCKEGYTRVQNKETGLYHCECIDECSDIITFEELYKDLDDGIGGNIPTMDYFNLVWYNFVYSIPYHAPYYGGIKLLSEDMNADPRYGNVGMAANGGLFLFGSYGGTQFKVVSFAAIDLILYESQVTCVGLMDGVEKFNMANFATLSSTQVTKITINNDIIINQFLCIASPSSSFLIDNIELIFV